MRVLVFCWLRLSSSKAIRFSQGGSPRYNPVPWRVTQVLRDICSGIRNLCVVFTYSQTPASLLYSWSLSWLMHSLFSFQMAAFYLKSMVLKIKGCLLGCFKPQVKCLKDPWTRCHHFLSLQPQPTPPSATLLSSKDIPHHLLSWHHCCQPRTLFLLYISNQIF